MAERKFWFEDLVEGAVKKHTLSQDASTIARRIWKNPDYDLSEMTEREFEIAAIAESHLEELGV